MKILGRNVKPDDFVIHTADRRGNPAVRCGRQTQGTAAGREELLVLVAPDTLGDGSPQTPEQVAASRTGNRSASVDSKTGTVCPSSRRCCGW